jgi:hypothetical protein
MTYHKIIAIIILFKCSIKTIMAILVQMQMWLHFSSAPNAHFSSPTIDNVVVYLKIF